MTKFQWIVFLLIESLLISLFIWQPSARTLGLLLLMQLEFLIARYAKLITSTKFVPSLARLSLYFTPYLLSMFFIVPKFPARGRLMFMGILAFFLGVGLFLPRIKELLNLFNQDFITMLPPIDRISVFFECYSLFGCAVFQEYFYRVYVIGSLYPYVGTVLSIFLAGLMFTAMHFLHHTSKHLFAPRDYINQFVMSIFGGVLYVYSGSIIIPMIVHGAYNSIIGSSVIFRFMVTRKLKPPLSINH